MDLFTILMLLQAFAMLPVMVFTYRRGLVYFNMLLIRTNRYGSTLGQQREKSSHFIFLGHYILTMNLLTFVVCCGVHVGVIPLVVAVLVLIMCMLISIHHVNSMYACRGDKNRLLSYMLKSDELRRTLPTLAMYILVMSGAYLETMAFFQILITILYAFLVEPTLVLQDEPILGETEEPGKQEIVRETLTVPPFHSQITLKIVINNITKTYRNLRSAYKENVAKNI